MNMFSRAVFNLSALLAFATLANAHFQMQFPTPRGPFVEDDEPNFCDGYTNAVSNRSVFPLDNGFITLDSEHPAWSAAVLISLEQNPTNFSVFNTTTSGTKLPFAVPFFGTTGEGAACIPIDIGKLGISGVQDGSNVTIQVQFSGGDGNLFQCADLTLSSSFSIPSNISCTHNVTSLPNTTSSDSPTSTATSPSGTNSSGALPLTVETSGLLGVFVALFLSFL